VTEGPGSVTVTPATGNGLDDNTVLTNTITNSSDTAQLVRFIITPYTRNASDEGEKCPGVSDTAYVWVEPVPRVSLTPAADTICTSLRSSIVTGTITRSLQPVKLSYEAQYNPAVLEVFYEQDTLDLDPGYAVIDSIVNLTDMPQSVTFVVYPYLMGPTGIRKCAGIPDTSMIWVAPELKVVTDTVSTFIGGKNIRCFGQNNGFIRLNPAGGITAFSGYQDDQLTYSWNNGWRVTQNIEGVYAGNYAVRITDKLHCADDSLFILTQPDLLISDIEIIDTLSCFGNDGTIGPLSTGGTPGYQYTWTTLPQDYFLDAPVSQDTLFTIMDGYYELLTADTNGCTVSTPLLVQQPQAMSIYVAPYNESGPYQIRCFAENSGTIVTQNSKGSILTYEWTGDNGFDTTYTNNNGINILNNLYAGRYTLEYTDNEGCKGFYVQDMTQPEPVTIDQATVSVYSGIYNVSCFDSEDGKIWLNSISGGHSYAPYSFDWDVVSGYGSPEPAARNQLHLGPGIYSVTVSDTFNCAVADTFELLAPGEILLNAELSSSIAGGYNLNCFGESNGFIKLQASGGGLPNFQYSWDHTSLVSNELYDLSAGDYRVTVTDGLGCQKRDTFTLLQPEALRIESASISDYNGFAIRCHGGSDGSIQITPGGGVPDYVFSWKRNGTLLPQDTATLENLGVGDYQLTVTDTNQCSIAWSGSLTEPAALEVTFTIENVNCTGTVPGNIQSHVAGGIAPYGFAWNNGATTPDISGLDTGTYVLTVQDLNLCQVSETAVVEQNTGVLIEIQVTDPISCNQASDGEIKAVPSGGVGPYTHVWQNGPSTQLYAGLGEGSYTVTVTDQEGCVGDQTIELNDPDPLRAVFAVNDALCYGSADGFVDLDAEGGTAVFRYYWNDNLLSGSTADHLTAGIYALRIVDIENCMTDTLVEVGQPDKLSVFLDERYTVYPFCPDWQNGAVAVQVSGGSRAYEYLWLDYPEEHDSILSEVKEDSYSLRIIDQHNCVADTTIRLTAQNSTCLGIPSAFTPNFDNANDIWDISYITEDGGEATFHEVYPNGVIQVYDRLGNLVYRCTGGCPEAWNGEDLKGMALPVDSYYYIIELNTGDDMGPLKGIVTIIR
jgi:gliding motility-associated-like protein